ncbi:MAG: RidA family protein [Gammaproteobacteria bacterium]|nr:RidA family protein [Gammaproteobacteria bacterium]
MALAAETASLDFHISPLLRSGGLAAQIRHSLNDLIRDTRGETIIKLRAYVAGAGDARRVQAEVSTLFTERKLPLPVLSVIQVGALEEEAAQVVIEATVSTRRAVNPNGLAFFAGQTAASFAQAVQRLRDSASAASVAPDHVLKATCFTGRLDSISAARATLQAAFPKADLDLAQAVRDPLSDVATCEAIGQLSQPPAEGPVVLFRSQRVTLVNCPRLVFTGLQLSFGSYLDDAHEALARLERAASALQPVQTPVKIDVFSLDPSGGSALRKTSTVPASTFTVQTIEGLPAIDATAGIEAVLALNVPTPAER